MFEGSAEAAAKCQHFDRAMIEPEGCVALLWRHVFRSTGPVPHPVGVAPSIHLLLGKIIAEIIILILKEINTEEN